MGQYQIRVIIGSLRKDSLNRKLANALSTLAPTDFVLQNTEIGNLPLYNQDDDTNQTESVKQFKNEIKNAHGIIFVTPEYNRSIPGVLKNAIDHASRPYGQSVWTQKPAGILGASVGSIGTALAQQHLRNILAYLDAPTLGQPEVFLQIKEDTFDQNGQLNNPNTKKFFQNWMDQYVAWVKKMSL